MSVIARDLVISRYLESLDPLPHISLERQHGASDRSLPPTFLARSSLDPPLTAFAQLGALRLNATRCLISLIDSTNQYILSEATQTLSLQDDSTHEVGDSLWLGACVIPRRQGVCEHVLELNTKDAPGSSVTSPAPQALIINDLQQDDRSRSIPHVHQSPHHRFYAGTPILTPQGQLIGVYCVFGSKPRQGISDAERRFLCDISKTVMEYLTLCLLRENDRRKEKMLRGLGSFVQGMSEIEPSADSGESVSIPIGMDDDANSTESKIPDPLREMQNATAALSPINESASSQSSYPLPIARSDPTPNSLQQTAALDSKEIRSSLQPKGADNLFSRAANIFHQSSDFAGVIFLDASASSSNRQAPNLASSRESGSASDKIVSADGSDQSSGPERVSIIHGIEYGKPPPEALLEYPRTLSFSMVRQTANTEGQDNSELLKITVQQMRSMLRRYSNGRILHFDPAGVFISSEGTSSSSDERRRRHRSASQDAILQSIRCALPGLKDLIIMPLWHHEQQRWAALKLCWTTQSHRRTAGAADLVFSRIFCDCIMNYISRLDASDTDRAKTTFIASISHEMRSPLNGILGSVQILADLVTDSFKADLVSSIDRCGKTLLDTLDNILDYSKINDFSQQRTRRSRFRSSGRSSRRGSNSKNSLTKDVDLSVISEEVVEAMFAGQNFKLFDRDTIGANLEADSGIRDGADGKITETPSVERKKVRILLDVGEGAQELVSCQAGIWRRIVMNLFGNSLKFTQQGVITVSLISRDIPNRPRYRRVVLTVTDTGKGISEIFQKGKLFTPFSQEDSFVPGTGLGLSIVKQLVDDLGGQIELNSEVGKGTQVKVSVPFLKAESFPMSTLVSNSLTLSKLSGRLQGRKICVVEGPVVDTLEDTYNRRFEVPQYGHTLTNAMKGWFGTDISYSAQWNTEHYDIIICAEPSLETLSRIRQRNRDGHIMQTILICLDAVEATALRGDNRLTDEANPVEIVQQPCGPWKLARVLKKCVDRLDNQNVIKVTSSMESTRIAGSSRPSLLSHWPSFPSSPPLSTLQLPRSILIVDDNPINLHVLSAFLTKQNLGHLSAVNGQEAVDIYKANPLGSIKYILMDLSMPVLDGLSATRMIRRHEKVQSSHASSQSSLLPQSPRFRSTVIALTGLASATAQIEALNAGIDDYMTKPVDFKALKELIK